MKAFRKTALVVSWLDVFWGLRSIAAATNWFRYAPSLENELVVVVSTAATLAGLAGAWAIRGGVGGVGARSNRSLALVAACLGMIATTSVEFWIFGGIPIPLGLHHVVKGPEGTVEPSDGTKLSYHLELVDPFSRHSRGYLVLSHEDEVDRIELPLLGGKHTFVEPVSAMDWSILSATSRSDVLCLRTTGLLRRTSYVVYVDEGFGRELASSDNLFGCSGGGAEWARHRPSDREEVPPE